MSESTLKERFIQAVNEGELGAADDYGVLVTQREFRTYFSDIKTKYKSSFLPAGIIESGRTELTHTQFLFRIAPGLYRVHPELLEVTPVKEYKARTYYFMKFGLFNSLG